MVLHRSMEISYSGPAWPFGRPVRTLPVLVTLTSNQILKLKLKKMQHLMLFVALVYNKSVWIYQYSALSSDFRLIIHHIKHICACICIIHRFRHISKKTPFKWDLLVHRGRRVPRNHLPKLTPGNQKQLVEWQRVSNGSDSGSTDVDVLKLRP